MESFCANLSKIAEVCDRKPADNLSPMAYEVAIRHCGEQVCFVMRRHCVAINNGGPMKGVHLIAYVEFAVF